MRTETTDIYEDLQRKLITAQFEPGQRLKPADLQGMYGCSANTVRDVLLRLTNLGLVDFALQKGFRARDATPERRKDVTRFRVLLEQEGATLSMAKGGVQWEARLTAAHHALSHIERQIAASGQLEPMMTLWSDAEREFHGVLISACGSPILIETFEGVYLQFRQQMVRWHGDFGGEYFRAIIIEHQAILDAALSRDAAACRQAIWNHQSRHV